MVQILMNEVRLMTELVKDRLLRRTEQVSARVEDSDGSETVLMRVRTVMECDTERIWEKTADRRTWWLSLRIHFKM